MHGIDRLCYTREYIDTYYGGDITKLNLLRRKGVYPYSYMDSMAKFEEGENDCHKNWWK